MKIRLPFQDMFEDKVFMAFYLKYLLGLAVLVALTFIYEVTLCPLHT